MDEDQNFNKTKRRTLQLQLENCNLRNEFTPAGLLLFISSFYLPFSYKSKRNLFQCKLNK